jgi:predicted DNA-binding transcriptional regulator YafY
MGDHVSRTQRLLRLVAAMKRGEYPNARTFADSCRKSRSGLAGLGPVCEKTILRDVAYLRQHLGAPVQYDAGKRGYFLGDSGWNFPSVELRGDALFAALLNLSDHESVQDVRLHCAVELAAVIRERDWFAGQEISTLSAGNLEIRYPMVPRVPFVRWILAHAGHLRVLGPADLREEVRKAAEELFWHHYDGARKSTPAVSR